MSYLLISDLVKDGRSALAAGNFWSAFTMALNLPSICGRLEFSGDSEYIVNKRNKSHWKDKKVYVDWCSKYLNKNGWLQKTLGPDIPEILYLLRCDMIHAGIADIKYGTRCFDFSINNASLQETAGIGNKSIIDLKTICEEIFSKVESWIFTSEAHTYKNTFVFNGSNYNDVLLYNALRSAPQDTTPAAKS